MSFFLRRSRPSPADVTLEAPARSFELTFRRPYRLLVWTVWRTVTRRYVVRGLPMRELLLLHRQMSLASHDLGGGLTEAQAVAFVLHDADALFFSPDQVSAVWSWYCEVNRLDPKASAAERAPQPDSGTGSSSSSPSSSAGPSTSSASASST